MQTESSGISSQPKNNISLSYDTFQEIINGLINSINNIYYDKEKETIINELQSILDKLNSMNTSKGEENEQKIVKKESEIGIYEGELKNDLRDGKGTMVWKDGDRYEGDWKNGKFEGNGRLKTADGKILEGEFYNDEYVDENKYKYNGKKSYYKKNYK